MKILFEPGSFSMKGFAVISLYSLAVYFINFLLIDIEDLVVSQLSDQELDLPENAVLEAMDNYSLKIFKTVYALTIIGIVFLSLNLLFLIYCTSKFSFTPDVGYRSFNVFCRGNEPKKNKDKKV